MLGNFFRSSLLVTKGSGGQYPSGKGLCRSRIRIAGTLLPQLYHSDTVSFLFPKGKDPPEESMIKDTNQELQRIFLACLPLSRDHWLPLEYLFQAAPIFQPSTHLMINKFILSTLGAVFAYWKRVNLYNICNSLKAASRAVNFSIHIQRSKDYVHATVINKGQGGKIIWKP